MVFLKIHGVRAQQRHSPVVVQDGSAGSPAWTAKTCVVRTGTR